MDISRYLAVLLLATLAACGGGGGSGGGDGGGGGGGGGGAPTPVIYSGSTSPAVVTTSNSAQLTTNVLGPESASQSISVTEKANAGDAVAKLLRRGLRQAVGQPPSPASAINIDDTQPCDSGAIHTAGTLNDNGTGTLQVTYNDCRVGADTFSGAATLRIDSISYPPLGLIGDGTLSFTRLTLRSAGGASFDLSGSVRTQTTIVPYVETFTENIVAQEAGGRVTKSENLVYSDRYPSLALRLGGYTRSISGRVFDSVHGYVEVSTPVPLVFGTATQSFPDSGVMQLTGAGNASVRATALSSSVVRLALDLNGDGVFEINATLRWTDLGGPVGADLRDSDGDGMHDSWELANNFNPNDPADALADADGDGATNLVEYRNGTRPNDAGSVPATVGLSLQLSDSPDPATAGGTLTYAINVSNTGSSAADNVVVTDTLPAGTNLVSATATQGSCSAAAATVTCHLGTIGTNAFNAVTVTIVVIPTAEGPISNVASVTSDSFDPNPADNSATTTTLVGVSASGLQGLIDAAAEGSTVLVPPGIYVGGLTFRGRNVALQSTGGPAVTSIHGSTVLDSTAVAVTIGPLGSIHGFTITGAGFGSGIEVSGTGTVISGNVFTGNNGGTNGFGAGIHGNNSSPVIRGNIFRNNNCDTQYISGVVVLVNTSSPRIFNNVFANNTCRAVNMGLPQFNAPEIINNTFVGNRAAIRVDRRVPQVTQVYRNNIIVANGIGLEVEFGSDADNPIWENNLVFGNTTNYSGTADRTGSNGNISVDPLFVNQAAGNYDLQAGSPAIGAGSPTNAPTTDFDGVARGGSIDIGAFEGP